MFSGTPAAAAITAERQMAAALAAATANFVTPRNPAHVGTASVAALQQLTSPVCFHSSFAEACFLGLLSFFNADFAAHSICR